MTDEALPLVEPDLAGSWRKNVWWFGFRWPFSLVLFSTWFLVFVVLGGFFALFYPIEKPKWLPSYPGFGVAWGFMPVLASYYIQALRIDLVGLGLAVFLGITVVEML